MGRTHVAGPGLRGILLFTLVTVVLGASEQRTSTAPDGITKIIPVVVNRTAEAKSTTNKAVTVTSAKKVYGASTVDPDWRIVPDTETLEEQVGGNLPVASHSPKLDVELVSIDPVTTKKHVPTPRALTTDLSDVDFVSAVFTSGPDDAGIIPTQTSDPDESTDYIKPTIIIDDSSDVRPIVPKCCPLGERILSEKRKCHPSPLEFIPPFLEFVYEDYEEASREAALLSDEDEYQENRPVVTIEEGYDIIVGNPCKYGRYRLEPFTDSKDEFYLLKNGSLLAPYLFDSVLGPNEFCMEAFPDTQTGEVVVLPLICLKSEDTEQRSGMQFIIYPIGLLISVPFLLVTLLAYGITRSLRDVHGKSLMCHCACLIVAYFSLAIVQLFGQSFKRELCQSLAFLIQFSFVACFFWLNVMCINTWHNMAFRASRRWCPQTERRRFVLYSMYAWSMPCLLISVSLIMELTPTLPSYLIKPRFGVDQCWFQSDKAALPYFYGPVSVLIVVNIILFILTAISILRINRGKAPKEAQALTSCYRRHNKTAFKSCLTMFAAMGVNWVLEIISWLVGGPPSIWYVTDTLNTLQGVIIFLTFVMNTHARKQIRKRLGELCQKRQNSQNDVDDFITRHNVYSCDSNQMSSERFEANSNGKMHWLYRVSVQK